MFDRDNALKYFFFVQWTHVTSVDHINSLFLPVTHIFTGIYQAVSLIGNQK